MFFDKDSKRKKFKVNFCAAKGGYVVECGVHQHCRSPMLFISDCDIVECEADLRVWCQKACLLNNSIFALFPFGSLTEDWSHLDRPRKPLYVSTPCMVASPQYLL